MTDTENVFDGFALYCEGTSYQEAANRLGISLNACKKRIQRAKQALKLAIEKNKLL